MYSDAMNAPRVSALARDVLEFGEFLKVGDGDLLGKPFEWQPFQREWIIKTFQNLPKGGRPRRSWLSVARRNGKTATVSVLVLAAIIGPIRKPGSLVISASRSREQASLVFRYCVKMLTASGMLHLVKVRESAREIEEPTTGTRFRAISADATNALGMGPSLVICDELGAVVGPHDALFSSLATSLGTFEDSLMVGISTQATSDGDLWSQLLDDALGGHDPATVVSLHAAPQDADPWAPETWRLANPAMGVFRSIRDIEQQSEEAKRLASRENAFRNYVLNQRCSTDTPFLTKEVWGACNGEPAESVFEAGPVYAGLDLSGRQDLTSLVLVAEDEARRLHVKCYAWTPAETVGDRELRDRAPFSGWIRDGYLRTTPGVSLSYEALALDIADICAPYNVAAINFDRWRIHDLVEEMAKTGVVLNLTPCGQGFKDSAPGVSETIHAALAREIRHGGNPLLTWCIANAVLELDAAGNGKLSKRRSSGRIDCAVALAMGIKACRVDREATGLAESEGLMFV